jgi:lipoprotein-anchoring transpeptidase ErfK/SrfK
VPPEKPAPAPQPVIPPPTAVPAPTAPTEPAEAPAPAEKPAARVRIVISLPAQRAYVFKDGKLWDSSRVSTGKKGKRTPVGTYTILEKARYHRSNKYSNAPMPYMQRITWGGVALHAGHVPGYPASHGCIRLPRNFAKRLYAITNFSSVVVVTDKSIDSAKEAREGF